jgi:hypothetical protein
MRREVFIPLCEENGLLTVDAKLQPHQVPNVINGGRRLHVGFLQNKTKRFLKHADTPASYA